MATVALTIPNAVRAAELDDRAPIQELLDDRATAVLNHDAELFRSTVAGHQSFVDLQMDRFEWASSVDLDDYSLEVDWSAYGNLSRPSDVKRYPGAESVAIPLTIERYRLKGFDESDGIESLFLTFVKRDGRWRIESDSDLEDIGFLTGRHVWDYGHVTSVVDGPFVALVRCRAQTDCVDSANRVLDLAAQGLERVRPYWDGPKPEGAVVLVAGSGPELKRILQATFDVNDFVAFAMSSETADDELWFSGPRIAFSPTALAGADRSRILHILSHEMLHIITRSASGPFVPLWLEEGYAEYAGTGADPAALSYFRSVVASGGFDGRLPQNHQFTTGDDIYDSYQKGLSAVRFMVERYGLDALNRLYADIGGRRVVAGTDRYLVDQAFRANLGLSLRNFERKWASSIR